MCRLNHQEGRRTRKPSMGAQCLIGKSWGSCGIGFCNITLAIATVFSVDCAACAREV